MFSRQIRIKPYQFVRTTFFKQPISYLFIQAQGFSHFTKSDKPLRPIMDKTLGHVMNGFWKLTNSAWSLLALRFKLFQNEKLLFAASKQRANAAFFNAYDSVPAYRKHIGKTIPATFSAIPETNKENYIKPYVESKQIHLTLVNGQLPREGQIDTSTGTSGKPTPWIRGPQEIKTGQTLATFTALNLFGFEKFIFINAFALGPWATGITVSKLALKRAIMFSTGPDKEKILNILQQFNPETYPGLKYFIAGYPPFMKDLIEEAIKNNIDIDKYQLTAIVGGEEISDGVRQHAMGVDREGNKVRPGFYRIFSTYGASDLDINIGYETDFILALRAACRMNLKFAKELFGENETIPMIFNFDPLNYFIETDKNNNLIFTCGRDDRLSPRIRYNLQDQGKVTLVSDVLTCAQKHHVYLPEPRTHLPLLFVWGRDNTINYRGSKVHASQLEEAISYTPGLTEIQNFAFNSYQKDALTQVEIWLELKKGVDIGPFLENRSELTKQLMYSLTDINQDFKFQIQNAPKDALPTIKFFTFGQSPMSNQDPQRKKKYIYQITGIEESKPEKKRALAI